MLGGVVILPGEFVDYQDFAGKETWDFLWRNSDSLDFDSHLQRELKVHAKHLVLTYPFHFFNNPLIYRQSQQVSKR